MKLFDNKNSLNNLYKSESTKQVIINVLTDEFDFAFKNLLIEAKSLKSFLHKEAIKYKSDIKLMFIQYGYPLETLLQLKDVIDAINEIKSNDENDCFYNDNAWD